ncbi:MAG: hypothetical protein A3I61_01240 [Acidobacteria bacterium RIFCSPLOWO2_02_FULL_68_18]|nr:MAG: hypothetical protein A3I61_01240 [Acidobacteria bacterium RIFCSPLOWO2_02_FULL_68_18]OFW51541.1 MAG: hypothetical protein A3G77_18640 [Acidobacteria bacterium RIFCSPLOWO2_12_FULL_68_19]
MSFIDSAIEALDRTEASLHSLITDALKAKAYGEVATIAALAQSLAAISAGRSQAKRSESTLTTPTPAAVPAASEVAKSEPSWMRPKNP